MAALSHHEPARLRVGRAGAIFCKAKSRCFDRRSGHPANGGAAQQIRLPKGVGHDRVGGGVPNDDQPVPAAICASIETIGPVSRPWEAAASSRRRRGFMEPSGHNHRHDVMRGRKQGPLAKGMAGVWMATAVKPGRGCCPFGTASNRSPQLCADGVSMQIAPGFPPSQER